MVRRKFLLISFTALLIFLAAMVGSVTFIILKVNASFLLVETERDWYTELVSGNYTDGHICFDFPTYSIDREANVLEDWGNDRTSGFELAYGSISYAGGLTDSGGAGGMDYIKDLPFIIEENVPWGRSSFNITITIEKDLDVLINGTEELKEGRSKLYHFDMVLTYYNKDPTGPENETCRIRYAQNTTVTNYGIWRLSNIEFGYNDEPNWWPWDLIMVQHDGRRR